MTGKYTIVIEPDLHKWFKHLAIDRELTVSALVVEAMETYKKNYYSKDISKAPVGDKPQNDLESSKSSQIAISSKSQHKNPNKYARKHYDPITLEFTDSPRAKRVKATADKALDMLSVAGSDGIATHIIHDLLAELGFEFGLRRDGLHYLKIKGLIRREREAWVHMKYDRKSSRRSLSKLA